VDDVTAVATTPSTLEAVDLATDIPHTFDYAATTGLGDTPGETGSAEADKALIATTLVSGDSTSTGTLLTITVGVVENDTAEIPGAGSVRITWDTTNLTFEDIVAGDLGELYVSDEGSDGDNAFLDVATHGNIENTDATPTFFTITFTTDDTENTSNTVSIEAAGAQLDMLPETDITIQDVPNSSSTVNGTVRNVTSYGLDVVRGKEVTVVFDAAPGFIIKGGEAITMGAPAVGKGMYVAPADEGHKFTVPGWAKAGGLTFIREASTDARITLMPELP
jgi:hypothetical protein